MITYSIPAFNFPVSDGAAGQGLAAAGSRQLAWVDFVPFAGAAQDVDLGSHYLILANGYSVQCRDDVGTARNVFFVGTDGTVHYYGYHGASLINAGDGSTSIYAGAGGAAPLYLVDHYTILDSTTYDNCGAKLQVNGGIQARGAVTAAPDAASAVLDYHSGCGRLMVGDGASGWNAPLAIQPYGGNLLIGTTTDNGTDKLQLNGTIRATSYKSSDGSAGVASATFTTVDGKTVTVKNGLITAVV